MRGVRLTKRVCLDWEPDDPDREEIYWDASGSGLGVRVTKQRKNGRRGRYFVLGYTTRLRAGDAPRRPRWRIYQIGTVARWTLRQAQDEAVRLNAMVNLGADPVADRRKARRRAAEAKTIRELAGLMMERHHGTSWEEPPPVGRRKIESKYAREDRRRWQRWVLPRIGKVFVSELTTADVDTLLRHVAANAGTTTANRVRSMLSIAFNRAEAWELRPQNTNPVVHATKYTEQRRQRILTKDELISVLDATDVLLAETTRAKSARDSLSRQRQLLAIQLAAETLRRPDEIFRLEWNWLSLEDRVVRLPRTKADRKGKMATGQSFGLSNRAIAILRKARALSAGSRFVFPSVRSDSSGHIATVRRMWGEVVGRAGIEDRPDLYTLKHTMISLSDEAGVELGSVKDQAGHGDIRTTEIYRRGSDARKVVTANALSQYVEQLRALDASGHG